MHPVVDRAPRWVGQAGLKIIFALAVCVLVSGCGGLRGGGDGFDPHNVPDAVPSKQARSRYGNPESYVVHGKRYYTLRTSAGFTERGIASWYGNPFHGQRTSSGEIYDMYRMTGAHKQVPLPTFVQVTNLDNGRTATLKINDRGPFADNRVIDLSYAAALKLGVVAKGTAFVEIRALDEHGQVSDEARLGPFPAPATSVPAPERAAAPVAPTPSLPTLSGMYLQIGAYAERGNAEKISRQLVPVITTGVEIREISSNNRVFYRVQIGPLPSTERADQVVAALKKLGITQHHFISN